MRQAGISPGVWVTNGANLAGAAQTDADFLIAEIEGPVDYNGVVSSLPWVKSDPRPKAVVTNFGGLIVQKADGSVDKDATKARCKPIVDAGFHCQYEAYFMSQEDNTNADHCGFPGDRVAPVLGIGFNGRTLDQQQALQVRGFGLYLAEYL